MTLERRTHVPSRSGLLRPKKPVNRNDATLFCPAALRKIFLPLPSARNQEALPPAPSLPPQPNSSNLVRPHIISPRSCPLGIAQGPRQKSFSRTPYKTLLTFLSCFNNPNTHYKSSPHFLSVPHRLPLASLWPFFSRDSVIPSLSG